jgi:acetyltransferase
MAFVRLAHQHRLVDGRTVTIRPLRADDHDRENEFLGTLSGESRYLRFQGWVAPPSEALIPSPTDLDPERHLTLLCSAPHDAGEEVVGEACYAVTPGSKSCEFGIVIADAWRKTGIAGLLMDDLIAAARERGLQVMEGQVLSSNITMLRLARALGFEIMVTPEDRTTTRIVKKL